MVRTINLIYDSDSRHLSADADLAGSSADVLTTVFHIDPIEGATIDLVADMSVMVGGVRIASPFARFDSEGNTKIPPYILRATKGSIELNVRVNHDDGTVENSEQIILLVADVPDTLDISADSDLVMTRNGSWDWIPTWTYNKGSVALYEGILYTSLTDGNIGNNPSDSDRWAPAVDVDEIADIVAGEMQIQIDAINETVDGLEGDVAELGSRVDGEADRAQQAEEALQQTIEANKVTVVSEVTSDGENPVKSSGIATYVDAKVGETAGTLNGALAQETARAKAREDEIEAIARSKSSEITTYAGTVNSVGALDRLNAEIGDYAIVTDDGTYLKDTSGWIKISGLDARWGNIAGSLADQTDISDALGGLSDRITELEENPAGKAEWGAITGTIEDQTDLIAKLQAYKNGAISQAETVATELVNESETMLLEEIDKKATKTEISDMLTKTEASSTYQPVGNYQPAGSYATTSQISDMLTKTLAQQTYQPKGDYAFKSEISAVYRYKGTVDSTDDLPTADVAVGDVWNVVNGENGESGQNYAWTEEGWDALGATVDLSDYATKADLDDVRVDPATIVVTSATQPTERVGLWLQPVGEIPSYDQEAF